MSRRRCARGEASAAPEAKLQAFAEGVEIREGIETAWHAGGRGRLQAHATAGTPTSGVQAQPDWPVHASVVQGSPSSHVAGSATLHGGTGLVVVDDVELDDDVEVEVVEVDAVVLEVELDVELLVIVVDVLVLVLVVEVVVDDVDDDELVLVVEDVEVELDDVLGDDEDVAVLEDDEVVVVVLDVVEEVVVESGSLEVVVVELGPVDVVAVEVGTSVDELVDEVVGTVSVVLVTSVSVVEVVASGADVEVEDVDDEVVEELVLDDEVVVVDVVVVVVVDPKVEAKPAIWTIVLLAVVMSSHVLTKSESGCCGSKTRPMGGLAKPSAKSASSGVLEPPTGRPVAGSTATRQISWSAKLV
jgi:hypothetical protein